MYYNVLRSLYKHFKHKEAESDFMYE